MGVTLVKKKATGDFYVRNVRIDHAGQRTSRKLGKMDSRSAKKIAAEWRVKLARGLIDFTNGRTTGIPLFGNFAEECIRDYARKMLKRNTWVRYQGILKTHLLPAWKNRRLDAIMKTDIRNLLFEKQKKGLVIS